MDITSKATMLKLHWMVPEGKIGVYVHVHDYFIAMDGGSLKPGLKSINQEQDIRNWLHEKEKQLRLV
jgi:predicted DNA-binding helix-hairpin-helix protein